MSLLRKEKSQNDLKKNQKLWGLAKFVFFYNNLNNFEYI